MKKSAVYSWRVAPDVLADLEQRAHREGVSVARLLDRIATQWLEAQRIASLGLETEQVRLRRRAAAAFGAIRGDDPARSEHVREVVRQRLRSRHGR